MSKTEAVAIPALVLKKKLKLWSRKAVAPIVLGLVIYLIRHLGHDANGLIEDHSLLRSDVAAPEFPPPRVGSGDIAETKSIGDIKAEAVGERK